MSNVEIQDFTGNVLNDHLGSGDGKREKGRQLPFSNLKMETVIQVLITGILILVFLICVYLTFNLISTKPEGIIMDDGHMEMFDPYARAKDLLTLIMPMFTTVISFWLGFTIQEKKVNRAEETANHAHKLRQKVEEMYQKMDKKMAKVDQVTTMMSDNEVSNHIRKIMKDENV